MKKIQKLFSCLLIVITMVFLLFAGVNNGFAQIANSTYVPSGYKLVFNDEFDNPDTKFVNWRPDNRDGRGDEWKDFATIESGVMKLKNIKLSATTTSGRAFTAPTCASVMQFKYGYFECRYKYAASNGFNNSFWLLTGAGQLSKDYIEIDVNEGQMDEGGKRNMASYLAAGAQPTWDQVRPMTLDHSNSKCTKPAYHYFDIDLSAEFHTYGFLWTPDSLSYLFDGKKILTHENKRIFSTEPVYRLLNYPLSVYLSSMNDASIPGFDKAKESSMDVDYVRVYQLPGSTDGLPPAIGTNLLKNSEFGSYDSQDYGGFMYAWNSNIGSVDKLFFEATISTSRTSPLYMPSQNINVLAQGTYQLRFKARVIETSGTASLRLKISNNDNVSLSTISNVTCVGGGGGVSGSEIIITQAQTPEMKTFIYRFSVVAPAPNATYTRIMFYLNNPSDAAIFQLDDVELIPFIANAGAEIVKDSKFDYDLKNNYDPTDLDAGWSAYENYNSGQITSSKVIEPNGNQFLRIKTNVAKDDYHQALAEYSYKQVAAGKYRITLRARTDSTSCKFHLKISTKSALATNLPANLTDTTLGVSLFSNKIYFTATTQWEEYSGVFDLNHTASEIMRLNFIFHQKGTFDIDDVKIEPYTIPDPNKQTQTISFSPLTAKTYGDANFNLSATATSDLPVTYRSIDPNVVSINGNVATINNAGSVKIIAEQAGNTSYNAAKQTEQTLTIAKAPLTITAENKTRMTGVINPVFTLSFNGLVKVDDRSKISIPTITCSATEQSPAGTYPITLTGGAASNYTITLVNGILTVSPNLGINTITKAGIALYPNPATTFFTIKRKTVLKEKLEIFNVSGTKVMEKILGSENETIDVGHLSKGVYILKINTVNYTILIQ